MKNIDLTLKVPSYKRAEFDASIAKLNKMAIKLGLEPIKATTLEANCVKKLKGDSKDELVVDSNLSVEDALYIRNNYTLVINYSVIKVTGSLPLIKGEWEIKGLVDFTDYETPNVVPFNNNELDKKYRTCSPTCDHCNTNRKRNRVFVLNDGNTELQVGETCLDKFTGDKMAREMAKFGEFFTQTTVQFMDDDCFHGVEPKRELLLEGFLELCLVDAKQRNFVTGRQATESLWSTSTLVMYAMTNNTKESNKLLSSLIKETSDETAELVNTLIQKHVDAYDVDTQSDFDYKLSQIAKHGIVTPKNAGFAAYIVGQYMKEQEQKRAATEINNTARPEPVKTRVKKEKLRFVRSITIDTFYGEQFISIFNDSENRVIVTKSANFFDKDMIADFTIKGEAEEYNGVIQTPVTRVKCVEVLNG